MIAVLDASAAVRTVMDPGTPFREALSIADLVIAPELIAAEVCSAFRKYVRAGALSRKTAERSIGQALALVDTMQPMRELVPEVLALSARTESSVYDLFYLALAQRTGATLFTADNALRKTAARVGIETVPQ
ncbi:MAG: type II toxin-antitoxin system VapC family toxin [Bryobacteraceae bacterium]